VHFANSAKASSAVQPALMMMPDHVPEFAILFCASTEKVKVQNKMLVHANKRDATFHLNGDYSMYAPGRTSSTPHSTANQ
jgi:hypothetical protein